jgi:hypothetical protein
MHAFESFAWVWIRLTIRALEIPGISIPIARFPIPCYSNSPSVTGCMLLLEAQFHTDFLDSYYNAE